MLLVIAVQMSTADLWRQTVSFCNRPGGACFKGGNSVRTSLGNLEQGSSELRRGVYRAASALPWRFFAGFVRFAGPVGAQFCCC